MELPSSPARHLVASQAHGGLAYKGFLRSGRWSCGVIIGSGSGGEESVVRTSLWQGTEERWGLGGGCPTVEAMGWEGHVSDKSKAECVCVWGGLQARLPLVSWAKSLSLSAHRR